MTTATASSGAAVTIPSGPPDEQLRTLKELKNAVIGNTWKKVEYASDDELLHYLLSQLVVPETEQQASIVVETAVILGALGSAGALTLRPLLAEGVPGALLALVRWLPGHAAAPRLLPALLRALRNVLGSTAEVLWGHMWGVGAEQKVVGTGLVGDDVLRPARVRSKAKAAQWRSDAANALVLVFEDANRHALLSLITLYPDPAVVLPLYQLLARVIALPSHRELLGLSSGGSGCPFLLEHLLETITEWHDHRTNPKLLEAALELVAALVKGQPVIARHIRSYNAPDDDGGDSESGAGAPEVISVLTQLMETGTSSVRIAVASCLTNIIKADKGGHMRDRVSDRLTNRNLLDVIIKLLRTEEIEERVKLCFVLAALVSDDERLQKEAADQGCASLLISALVEVDGDETRGDMGHDAASRMREGALLALAALAFQYEPTRSLIADASPPVLPLVCSALSHPSYGVRVAACQLARALSRTIAILKTSLVDSGVGEEVVETLRREVARRADEGGELPAEFDVTAEEELGDRAWTVEVAATATICNLVTDFSPLRAKLVMSGGVELLVSLTSSSYEPLALNALWALKNLTYHASETLKADVVRALSWRRLAELISPRTPPQLRTQALHLLQNVVDQASKAELSRTLDALGSGIADGVLDLDRLDGLDGLDRIDDEPSGPSGTSGMDSIVSALSADDLELRKPALYILSNLALGNERVRGVLLGRVEVLEGISDALGSKVDALRVPALRTLRHLLESNSTSRRPRPAVVEAIKPYQYKARLKDIWENSPNLTVKSLSQNLLEILDRAKDRT